LRISEIDTLSTLGARAIDLLSHTSDLTTNWSETDKYLLERFAAWRTMGKMQILAQFPNLISHDAHIEQPFTTAPTHDEMSLALLEETHSYYPGVLPLLITAPHGGRQTTFGAHRLSRSPFSTPRDGATAEITRDISTFLTKEDRPVPFTLIDEVHRAYRTPQTRAHFETQTYRALGDMRDVFDTKDPLLHLDIHGFGPAPDTAQYDLIFGTGHEHCTNGLNATREIVGFMREEGYVTNLPTRAPEDSEYFTSDYAGSLAQRVRSLNIPNIGSIQIEINSRFRTLEGKKDGERLARHLGNFCLLWAGL
jgi:hypothetical protein